MATKEHKRQARGLIEKLECRVHAGPPIHANELVSAQEFLRQSEFAPSSEYFSRLSQIQHRLSTRTIEPAAPRSKRNYGGEAAGYWMQVQSAYDHVILSTCYDGEFNMRQGRIKISHRFNAEGRIDFVELKLLRSLQPLLNGAIRKLLTVKDYPEIRRNWNAADAYILEVLPRELIFLYGDLFRCPKTELFGWLINIGHRLAGDLLKDLETRALLGWTPRPPRNPEQACLTALRTDDVAHPILDKAATLEAAVELQGSKLALVKYRGT